MSSDDDMPTVLRRFGIPLDFGVTDPTVALTGGAAKAEIYQAHLALEAGRFDDAIEHASAVLRDEALHADSRYSSLVAVTLYVRGRAHQAASHPDMALRDYQAALTAAPSHELARQALAGMEG